MHFGGAGLPRPSVVVKWLLIINFAVFLVQIFADRSLAISGVFGATVNGWWQVWRYITFQFLHAGVWHIAMNMLGLYLLGSPLERQWGSRRFLWFYLSCGAFAGVLYVGVGAMSSLSEFVPLIGASGGVFGILLADAVLMPHFRILLLLFFVPIRLAAVIIFGIAILSVLSAVAQGQTAAVMSHIAHLGGAIMAALWVWWPRISGGLNLPRPGGSTGAWERKQRKKAQLQEEVDRILLKVHQNGLASLSRGERKFLQKATRMQQQQDRRYNNM